MSGKRTEHVIPDPENEEWVRIESFMPKPPKRGRKSSVDRQEVMNDICYMARSVDRCRILPIY